MGYTHFTGIDAKSIKQNGVQVALSTDVAKAIAVTAPAVIAGGATKTAGASDEGGIVLLDTAAGTTVTLPAATGTGNKFKFIVSVKPTSNQHRIDAPGTSVFYGSINILDLDAAAQGAFASGSGNNRIDFNGTTKGGQVGDMIEVVDIGTNAYAVFGQARCPAGSNPVTPFATRT